MKLTVIDNCYDGIGDAVLYAWLIHSAHAAGLTHFRVNMRRHVEMAYLFGVTPGMTTFEPGERSFTDRGKGSEQTAQEIARADTIGTRFNAWAEYLGIVAGGRAVPPVRPPYVEHPLAAEWAEKAWADRDRETGKTTRVLVFPETYWQSRQWPLAYFKDLAGALDAGGCNAVAMLPTTKNAAGFPYFFHGINLYSMAAMIARADLVIGPDSGPAHIAGTIGVPTLAVCGPTRPEIVFGHMPGVEGVTIGEEALPCVGCHFRGSRGFRHACGDGCQGLLRLTPETVYDRVKAVLDARVVEPASSPAEAAPCR